MSLTSVKEDFLRDFFARQRSIGKQALDTTRLLARTNIESIVWAGLPSPLVHDKIDETLKEIRDERAKQSAADLDKNVADLQKREEELSNGN